MRRHGRTLRALAAVLLIVALLLMASFPPALQAQELEGAEGSAEGRLPVVKVIEVKGLERIFEGSVRTRISQKVGERLRFDRLSEDIRAIFDMGFFEDVQVETEPFEGGLKLIYRLKEKPAVMSVDFYGNEEVGREKLDEQVDIVQGTLYDIMLVTRNKGRLRAVYEKEGYYLAEIVPVIRLLPDSRVYLTFLIREGEKVKIDEIEIEGNEAFPDGDIEDVMKTSEHWLFSFLTGSGKYERVVVDRDLERIQNFYLDHGYINVEVGEPRKKISEDRKRMTLSIDVNEGRQYMVGQIGIEGNTVFTDEELLGDRKLRTGDVVDRSRMIKDMQRMTEMYTERGYLMARIYPDIIPEEESRTVKLTYQVSEDEIYTMERVVISGNHKTRDKVIRREIRINEGERYDSAELNESYRKLRTLDLFETIDLRPVPDLDRKTVELEVSVEEKATGFLNVGGGYSSVDRLVAMVDFTQRNLGGRGQLLKLSTEVGSRTNTYQIQFRDPWIFDYPVGFDSSIYRTRREYINYTKRSSGFSLGLSKTFSKYWFTGLSYSFEEATIYDVDDDATSFIKDQEGESITSSITPSLGRNSLDNYVSPHDGSRNIARLQYAGIGGDNKFIVLSLDSVWVFPVTANSEVSFRGRYGYATGIGGEELPAYERFYVGGIRTVRGIDYGNAGPLDENDTPIGGEQRLVFNTEYVFPIVDQLNLKGVVFYDAGAAFDQFDELDLRHSTGFGVRWISPMGPMRLEWGYNLDPLEFERKSKWEFTFGTFL